MCWKKKGELTDAPIIAENGGGGGGDDGRYSDAEVELIIRYSWPVKSRAMQKMSPYTRKGPCYEMAMNSDFNQLEYPDDIKYLVSMLKPPMIDNPFDLLSLLSFNGNSNYLFRNNPARARVVLDKDTFKGKRVMVCCFQAPMFRLHDHAPDFQSVADICSEMYSSNSGRDDDFEMVVVVKMIPKLADHERVFDHFLSAFPSSCLVVPFNDPKRRDYICHYLNASHWCTCLIVDSSGIVSHHDYPDFASEVGADAFPFNRPLRSLYAKDEPVWETPSTTQLVQLLGCTTVASDKMELLYKVQPDGCRKEVASVSKLKDKVVGLYILVEGEFMSKLDELYEECRGLKLEFEIVVVYIPFGDCLDPEAYQRKMDGLMKKHCMSSSSWWRMPFNNSHCRRLARLCKHCSDQLVIVGPHDEYVVPFGREALHFTGAGARAYPFKDFRNFRPPYY